MPTTESGSSVVESDSACMVSCTPWSFLELSFNSVAEVSDSTVTSQPRSLICSSNLLILWNPNISTKSKPFKGTGPWYFRPQFLSWKKSTLTLTSRTWLYSLGYVFMGEPLAVDLLWPRSRSPKTGRLRNFVGEVTFLFWHAKLSKGKGKVAIFYNNSIIFAVMD